MRRTAAALASACFVLGLAACGDTDDDPVPADDPGVSSSTSTTDLYNDMDNDGEAPAGEDSPGGGEDGGKANPDAENTDR